MNHFKILKEFQGCLSIQLSKICITQTQYLSGVLSLICYRLPRRLVYNIIRYTHCQQLFLIFFKKGIAFFAERCYNAEVPNGGVAQLGERLNGIQEVNGSIPSISTIGFSPDVCAQSRI